VAPPSARLGCRLLLPPKASFEAPRHTIDSRPPATLRLVCHNSLLDSAWTHALNSDIDQRRGWPEELCIVLKDHPRETWKGTRSEMARFWIGKHDYLRRQSDALQSANDDYRAQRASPMQFGNWLAPRLQGFLAELHGHHQIEDFHYFPAFRSAEPRLGAGFDVLASDHELIHEGIVAIVEAINEFIATLRNDSAPNADAQRHAADRYIAASRLLHQRLQRHLADEEDLIIPLMIRHEGQGRDVGGG
jgi:hemerythrin-like domain-containing protein